jgi:bifunctional UDP-N-acetylglucosamine pyrophosphorylase/glucosamine-1-phosphate N-acetyltransferase
MAKRRSTAAPKRDSARLLAVVLAAGKGTRMRSSTPKVLHRLAGVPMIDYPVALARRLGAAEVVVVHAPGQDKVLGELLPGVHLVTQRKRLGTGHALRQVPDRLRDCTDVLVLYGDVPLLTEATVRRLITARRRRRLDCGLLAARLEDPTGYGRIVGDGGEARIVEEADATAEEARVDLVNTGVCCFAAAALWPPLDRVRKSPGGEYYLTSAFAAMPRRAVLECTEEEALGVNDRWQLARAEKVVRRRINRHLALSGVTIVDPDATYIDAGVEVEPDAVIEPFTFLRGRTRIGARSHIGPFAEITDCQVGSDCSVGRSHLVASRVEDGVDIGPFNRLRPGSVVATGSRIGSFAEIKNSVVGPDSDVHHFSYLGDAFLGRGVNIGAGAVTANYDGRDKNRTIIGDGAFIGVDSVLIAPVTVGEGAYTAAGSVVNQDVAAGSLAIERAELRQVAGWSARRKARQAAPPKGGG